MKTTPRTVTIETVSRRNIISFHVDVKIRGVEMEETEGEILQAKPTLEESPPSEQVYKDDPDLEPHEPSTIKFEETKPQPTSSAASTDNYNGRTWPEYSAPENDNGIWLLGELGESQDRDIHPDLICKSETEETPSTDSKEKSSESAQSSEALSNVYSKLSPFNIHWTFGVSRHVEIINLTTADVFEVYFVSSHFGVIYNYKEDRMTFLPGHNYNISSIDADASGRWLVSADEGEDNVIIIWDKLKKLPVWSLYDVFPREGVHTVKISQDGRFLAAVNCHPDHVLKFWLWTYGRDEPDGVFEVGSSHGKAKRVNFNHVKTEQFVLTCELAVVFYEWDVKSKSLKSHLPRTDGRRKKLGQLRESIFLDDNHRVLTSTSLGYILVWSDLKYNDPNVPEKPGTIEKNFLKTLKFHKSGITTLRLCDGVIATASEGGIVLFHDQQCRLVFCISHVQLPPLLSISFNVDQPSCTQDPFAFISSSTSFEDEEVQNVFDYYPMDNMDSVMSTYETEEDQDEVSVSGKISCEYSQPADCTLEMKPFDIRDFMFLTSTGRIGYMSHRRKKVRYYLYDTEGFILSIDCHPSKPHVIMGSSHGRVILYEHQTPLKKRLLSVNFSSAVTTLKYSNFGASLMAGFQNGDLLELNPVLLHQKLKLDPSKAPIEKICFSPRDDLLAYYDLSSTIHVYKKKSNSAWVCMGKYISHYKPIVDILFDVHPDDPKLARLFTIGQDRMLVEYDMKNLEENKLKILSTFRIEQTAVPQCFASLNNLYKTPHFLVSNDQYKLKVLDAKNLTCKKTTLGPTADTPIKLMKVVRNPESDPHPEKGKMIYTTDKHIGIRILPPTGNPFEGMGMVAHPFKLADLVLSHDHRYVFTVGVRDTTPLMWEVNLPSVDVASQLGGNGLEPFVSLMEGGPNSFLFKEMEDFFYYAQIIHQGEDPNLDRSVSKYLALCEIPDLFRALGFYPTDYEVNNLMHELKHLEFEKTGEITTEITFEECVKAYLNHRPVNGISLTDINNALLAIADLSDPSDIIIEKNELYKALETRAEAMEHPEVVGYLCILLLPKDEENPIAHHLALSAFAETVLGIDLTITEENVRQITHAFEAN